LTELGILQTRRMTAVTSRLQVRNLRINLFSSFDYLTMLCDYSFRLKMTAQL